MKKTTILIVDDHKLVRNSLAIMFNANPLFEVVRECSSGEDAMKSAASLKPDIIFMDVNLPGINGIETTTQILLRNPDQKIIGLSMHANKIVARKMLLAGARGYMTKNSSNVELLTAINQVMNNQPYIGTEIKQKLAEELISNDKEAIPLKKLTEKELAIIGFIKRGFSSREIAQTLSKSIKTIEVHRYNILKKLQLTNVASLVNYANNSMYMFN